MFLPISFQEQQQARKIILSWSWNKVKHTLGQQSFPEGANILFTLKSILRHKVFTQLQQT